jgi:predicted PurR-regulated permease PerM
LLLVILFIHQVETNVLTPFVMGKQTDLHPVITTAAKINGNWIRKPASL